MNLIRRNQERWLDPFEIVSSLQQEMNDLFSSSLRGPRSDRWAGAFSPEIDVVESANQYLVKADLPGIQKEHLDISFAGSTVTIKGERKEESEKKEKNYHYVERRFGSFSRSFEFPTEVDAGQVKAVFKDGVLELVVPKSENAKPKQIKVDVK